MDPSELLRRALAGARMVIDCSDGAGRAEALGFAERVEAALSAASDLADAVLSLDLWMGNGNALPAPWEDARFGRR